MTENGDETVILGNRYELGGLLGRGGMADVRVGRDLRLGRTVAVKLLRADLASDDTFQERFRREAQSAASLNHPSIVAVYDTGETIDATGRKLPYIVMEYVEGQTLRDAMKDDRRILPERALSITADILSALDYSHRSGIVHRDIKPANVMLTPSGQLKVMDFGIARAIADSSSAMTQTAAVIGTAQYLSPEQARGETVDARSDIYSTGCLMYELLTGRPPFVGDSPVSVAYQHVREEAHPPSQLNPDVGVSVDNIVAKALAKRVDDRYQSAADMRRDIERVLAGLNVDAPVAPTVVVGGPIGAATAVVPSVSGNTGVSPAIPADDEPEKGNGKWWGIGIVAVLLLGALGYGIFQWTKPEPIPQVTVTDVVGKEFETAKRALEADLFVVADPVREPSDAPVGEVIAQDPEAGTTQDEGTIVTLTVSSGPEEVVMPDVKGYKYGEAKQKLEKEFRLNVRKEERDSSLTKGEVINSDPLAGQSVVVGSTVTLLVSKGQVEVPDVVGESISDAKRILDEADLKVTVREDPDASEPADVVTDQTPGRGTRVSPGSTVTITVSTNPGDEPEPTPTTPSPTDTLLPPPDDDEDF